MNFEKFDDAKKDDSVLNSFTRDQKIAYENLVAFIEKGYVAGDYKRALIGSAGTGKTYMIREVIRRCGLSKSVIGLAAPTHKAARVLRASTGYSTSTVASDLGLRLNTDVTDFDINNPPFDPLAEKKIKQYKLYIVDEASMIGINLKTLIERECEQFGCMLILWVMLINFNQLKSLVHVVLIMLSFILLDRLLDKKKIILLVSY